MSEINPQWTPWEKEQLSLKHVYGKWLSFRMKDVLYVPTARQNLFSVRLSCG